MANTRRAERKYLFAFALIALAFVLLAASAAQPSGDRTYPDDQLLPSFGDGTVNYTITVTNATSSAGTSGTADSGVAFNVTFTAGSGYYLPDDLEVKIGGTTIVINDDYSYDCDTGELQIFAASVTGNISITCTAIAYEYVVPINVINGTQTLLFAKAGEDFETTISADIHYSLPSDIEVKVNSAVLSSGSYDYDQSTGDISIYGYNITSAGIILIEGTCTADSYSITYDLDGGTAGGIYPSSSYFDTEFSLAAPTRTDYTFIGWKVTSGLDTDGAYWGTASANIRLTSSDTLCVNGTSGAVYFKNLASGSSVTIKAFWAQNVPLPIHSDDPMVYTGSELTYYPSNYDSTKMVISGNSATDCGTYTTVVISLVSTGEYVWADGTTNAKSDYFTITPKTIVKPSASYQVFTYNAGYQEYYPRNYDSDWMVISNNSQRNAGTYSVHVDLKDPANTTWVGGTTSQLTFTFIMNKKSLAKPTASTETFTYNGEEQYYIPVGYSSINTHADIDGYERTDAGSQQVTVSIKEPANCYWGSNMSDVADVHFIFTINKAVFAVPTIGSKVYNCQPQTADITSTADYTVDENLGGTDVGGYDVVLSLTASKFANYRWDGHTESEQSVTLTFSITQATITSVTTAYNPTYDGTVKGPAKSELTYHGTGIDFITPPSDASVTVALKSGYDGTTAGVHYMTISVSGDLNYSDYSGEFSFTINKLGIAKPTEDPNKDDFVYTGTVLTYSPSGITAQMDVTNDTRTHAGTQIVSVNINDMTNYMWTDGTQVTVNFTFTVKKAVKDVPVISSKPYNCTTQVATFDDSSYFDIITNDGGEDVGTYPVEISLKDEIYPDFRWDGYGEDVRDLSLTFSIVQATLNGITTTYTCVYDGSPHLPAKSDLSYTGFTKGPKDSTVTIDHLSGDPGITATTHTAVVTVIGDSNFLDYTGTVTFVITKAKLAVPTANETVFIYTGEEQTYYPDGFDGNTMDIADNKRTIAGSQTVRVNIHDTFNYIWATDDADERTYTFEILKRSLPVPAADTTTFVYNGEDQTYTPVNYEPETMTITGNVRQTAGEQTVNVSITDTANYQWQGGGQAAMDFQFRIWKASLDVPSAGSAVYNCGIQRSALTDTLYYTVEKNEGGITVGSYPVELKIIDDIFVNYRWSTSDEATQTITLQFQILKADITTVSTPYTRTYSGSVQTPVKSDMVYTGFSTRPSESSVTLTLMDDDEGIVAGTHTMIIRVIGDNNFNNYAGFVEYVISQYGLTKPTADTSTFTYDGTEHTYSPEGVDENMTVTNDRRVAAGSQTVHVDITDLVNYSWVGGGQETVDFTFVVNKATYDMSDVEFKDSSKVYDGTAQTLAVSGTLPTGLDGIQVTVGYAGSATHVSEGPIQVTASFQTSSENYYAPSQMSAYITIVQRPVTVSGITALDKVYDGTTDVTMVTADVTIKDLIEGDILTVASEGHFVSKDCSDAQEIAIDSIRIGGGSSSDYILADSGSQTVAHAKISPKQVLILGAGAQSKIYDGTIDAQPDSNVPTLSWKYESDDVTIAVGSGSFSDKNVGIGKTVSFHGYTLIGDDAPNYDYEQPADTTADISQKTIRLINGSRSISKEYDGTTDGIKLLYGQHYSFDGVVTGDRVRLVDVTGEYDLPTVYASKITIDSLEIDNGNYVAVNNVLAAYISSRLLTLANGPIPIEKVYDGTNIGSTLIEGQHYVFSNLIAGDYVDFIDTQYRYSSTTVGLCTITIQNTLLNDINYRITSVTLPAKINPLTVSMINGSTPITKVYDGSNEFYGFTKDMYRITGVLEGDEVDLMSTAGHFDSSTVDAKRFILKSAELDNVNYVLEENELDGSILPKDVTILGLSVQSKGYDGTVDAKVIGTPRLSWKLTGDDVDIVNGRAEFDSRDSGKRIAYFFDYSLSGKDSANYNLSEQPAPVESYIETVLGDQSSVTVTIITAMIPCIIGIAGAIMFIRRKL